MLTRTSLVNNPKEVTVFLAEDEHGKIANNVHLGKINESIPLQSIIILIVLFLIVMYFRNYMHNIFGDILIAYGLALIAVAIYAWMLKREYRGKCVIKMQDIIKEYEHHELIDRKILRDSLNQIRNENSMINDFPKLIRATFLKNKKKMFDEEKEYDRIIAESENKTVSEIVSK